MDRAPIEYVETVFDGYAARFEEHLVALGYRVPGLVAAILGCRFQAADASVGPVLDLGCGTGLLGLVCSDLPLGPWVGVDASGNMLAGARGKGVYAELVHDDLMRFLAADERLYPVILAGDVFCYFGKLEEAFAAAAGRLAPGGTFVVSLERGEGSPTPSLGPSGRWAHPEAYVRKAVKDAGLRCASFSDEELRREHGEPVGGMLLVLEHAAAAPA